MAMETWKVLITAGSGTARKEESNSSDDMEVARYKPRTNGESIVKPEGRAKKSSYGSSRMVACRREISRMKTGRDMVK